jgi:hypothetical protein
MEGDGVTQQMLSAGDIYVNGLKKIFVSKIPPKTGPAINQVSPFFYKKIKEKLSLLRQVNSNRVIFLINLCSIIVLSTQT